LRGSTLVWDWLSILQGGGRADRRGLHQGITAGLVGNQIRKLDWKGGQKKNANLISHRLNDVFKLQNSEKDKMIFLS
jgi:hypothetical protein